MNNNNEILEELKEISAVLAAIPRVNCYKIPENYFINEFEQNAETAIVADKLSLFNKNPFVLPTTLDSNAIFDGVEVALILESFPAVKNCFVAPINYFSALSNALAFAVSDKKMVHGLPNYKITNAAFKLPNNYFNDLEESLLIAVNDNLIDESVALPKESFAVPNNYFNNLSENILATVKNEDEEKLNPLFEQMRSEKIFLTPDNYLESLTENILNSIGGEQNTEKLETLVGKNAGFTTPLAYFDGLSSRLTRKVKNENGKKRNKVLTQVFSIATLCLIFGLSLFFFNKADNNDAFANQLASLSTAEIEQFITENEADFDEFLLTEFVEDDFNFELLEEAVITDEDLEYYLLDVDENFINNL